jgi:hypothetical protein
MLAVEFTAIKWLLRFVLGALRRPFSLANTLLRGAFGHPRFVEIAQEFFTEAAVLVFVFPVLDTIVQFGPKKVTWRLALGSVGTAVFLLFWAGILAKKRN